ncbi:FHA domain-containing protein [Candidatus Sumerlaeota bacterium]|nr:FHA domain-containing protein [Candidatus Sumerlaeota bacterium]
MADGRLIVEGRSNWAYTVWLTGQESFILGRGTMADIKIEDSGASKQHARITLEEGRYVLTDLNSSNGTFVNGERIKQQVLRNEDDIRIGKSLLSFIDGSVSRQIDSDFARTISDGVKRLEPIGQPLLKSVHRLDETVVGLGKQFEGSDETEKEWHNLRQEMRKLRKEIRQLSRTNTYHRFLSMDLPFNQRLDLAIAHLAEETHSQNGFVMMIDPRTEKWVVRSRYGTIADWTGDKHSRPMSLSIVRKTVEDGKTIISSSLMDDERFEQAQSILMLEIKAAICSPIFNSKRQVIGVVYVDRRTEVDAYANKQQRQVDSFAEVLTSIALMS